MFGNVSGNHITLLLRLDLQLVASSLGKMFLYYIVAQVLGAMFGQLVVVATHRPTTFKLKIQTISWEHSQRFLVWIKELLNHARLLPLMVSSTSLPDHSSFSLVPSAWRNISLVQRLQVLLKKLLLNKERLWCYHISSKIGFITSTRFRFRNCSLGSWFPCYGSCYVTWRSYWTWFEPCTWLWSSFGPCLPSKVYLGRTQRGF